MNLYSYNGQIIGGTSNQVYGCSVCPCDQNCPWYSPNPCPGCMIVKISGAGKYNQGNYNSAGMPMYITPGGAHNSLRGPCSDPTFIYYRDYIYCGLMYMNGSWDYGNYCAVMRCWAPVYWDSIYAYYGGVQIEQQGGWFLNINGYWYGSTNPYANPPLILQPETPDLSHPTCPPSGNWVVAWCPPGFDCSSVVCTVTSSPCGVCSYSSVVNCLTDLSKCNCKVFSSATVSGVPAGCGLSNPDCADVLNRDWGPLNQISGGPWYNAAQNAFIGCVDIGGGVYKWQFFCQVYHDFWNYASGYATIDADADGCPQTGSYTFHPWDPYGDACSQCPQDVATLVLT